MLASFGGSSKGTHINGRFTNLCLTGGVDCVSGLTPDLKVAGGARIKKTLCVKGLTMLNELIVDANTTTNYLTVMKDTSVCGDLHVKGNLLVDELSTLNNLNGNIIFGNTLNIMRDATVCGNLHVKGDFLVDGSFTFNVLSANVILGNTLNIMNDAAVCGDLHVKGNLIVDGSFGNVLNAVVLDSMATPTYPDNTNTKGVWYGENTFANSFDITSVTLGLNAVTGATSDISIGNQAATYGSESVSVGHQSQCSGIRCVAIGNNSKTSGSNCVSVGSFAGSTTSSGNNVTCIGNNAQPTTPTTSNEITLGNSAVTAVRSYGAWTFLSDRRDKKDITSINAGIDFVSKLKPVNFMWNMRDGGKIDISDNGFIAQDLQEIQKETGILVPGLVYESNPERLEISTMKLIPILVKALQECREEILQLKSKLL